MTHEKLLAIIAETSIQQDKDRNLVVFTLWLLGVSEQYRSRKIKKGYFCKDGIPQNLQRDFLTLGIRINSMDELAELSEQLVGRIVRMSIVPDDAGKRRFYIDEYVGSDDPSKYFPQNDQVQE